MEVDANTIRVKPPSDAAAVTDFVKAILREKLPQAGVAEVRPMTPDASLRRYYRVLFSSPVEISNGPVKTAIVMLFDSVASPEATGSKIDSDRAYVEMAEFFSRSRVATPALFVDERPSSLLLIEDLGDRHLIDVAKSGDRKTVESAFRDAIGEIRNIQDIPPVESFFAYERAFRASTYVKEMEEFRDFCLLPVNPVAKAVQDTEALFAHLAPVLENFPQTLVHRDFHAWNLLVDAKGKVWVIDFQDALVATVPYDLVSLINDRDMDSVLGEGLYCDLVKYGADKLSRPGLSREDFLYQYDRVLLQRDLKVSGRFAKLVKLRGLNHYGLWIAGTLRRIGRTLERITAQGPESNVYAEFLSSVAPLLSEIEAGRKSPVRFF